jgi:transcriptional regulator GlxA family with amidase domain
MSEPLSMDQAFIRKLTEIVLANLGDENFSVEKLAKEAGMSRMSVHRRIKSIKHQDVSQFVREVRLKRAIEMLQNNEGTSAEIGFRVGFGSATYFNKCFHAYFGFPPGEARIMESAESLKDHADEQPI